MPPFAWNKAPSGASGNAGAGGASAGMGLENRAAVTTSFAAREVFVGTMNILYHVEENNAGSTARRCSSGWANCSRTDRGRAKRTPRTCCATAWRKPPRGWHAGFHRGDMRVIVSVLRLCNAVRRHTGGHRPRNRALEMGHVPARLPDILRHGFRAAGVPARERPRRLTISLP